MFKTCVFIFIGFLCLFFKSQNCESEKNYYTDVLKEIKNEKDAIMEILKKKKSDVYTAYETQFNQVIFYSFVSIPGVLKTIRIDSNARLKITVHCHFLTTDDKGRIDVAIFINGIMTGLEITSANSEFVHGMALSHSPYWTTGVSLASKSFIPGDYTIEAKTRIYASTKLGYVSGVGMLIEVFYE